MQRKVRVDRLLALLIGTLLVGGSLIFASAAFGSLARGKSLTSVVFGHFVLGVGLGTVALLTFTFFDYRRLRKYAPWLYALAIAATALVFVPHIGISHGGGRRWIVLFGTSFQPSEVLKVAVIIASAAYFSSIGAETKTFLRGLCGFAAILAVPSLLLLLQPDMGTLGVIVISVAAVYFAAGARIRDMLIFACVALLALALLATFRPYVRDRVQTFFDPSQNKHAESYQLTQSLIAIGSGGFTGRGLGQGVQKFKYLPEPMGDSIFAVAGEELGFAGASIVIILFLGLAVRGYGVAARAPDHFGGLLAVGISTYLAVEAFINMGSMLGLVPLTGIPLTFISQVGSAMLASLCAAGILLNVSYKRRAG